MNESKAKEWSKAEKILLPVSLLIAILFDRLIVSGVIFGTFEFLWGLGDGSFYARGFYATFWLCFIVIFYVFYWKQTKNNIVAWVVAVCSVALCVWSFIYPEQNQAFSTITMFVIPSILMAHVQWVAGGCTFKNSAGMFAAWYIGWGIKPFSGLGEFFGIMGSVAKKGNRPMVKRVIIGVLVAAGMLLVILPLLMSADQVFNHYLSGVFVNFSLGRIILHLFVIIIAFGLFYSFLWNVGFGKNERHTLPNTWSIDIVVSSVALGVVILIYVLFCIIQFTYLFAGAGLPEGMTFAEYARAGFAQTVAVCAINLLIFGIFSRFFGQKNKTQTILLKGLLGGLLAATAIMLVSGWVRLGLYIEIFGMTWLRLLSAWFIIYMAAVVLLCVVHLFVKKIKGIVVLCALMLLIFYVVLGYINPDGFVFWYNSEILGYNFEGSFIRQ